MIHIIVSFTPDLTLFTDKIMIENKDENNEERKGTGNQPRLNDCLFSRAAGAGALGVADDCSRTQSPDYGFY